MFLNNLKRKWKYVARDRLFTIQTFDLEHGPIGRKKHLKVEKSNIVQQFPPRGSFRLR